MDRKRRKISRPLSQNQRKVPPKSLSAKNCLVCFCLFNENEKKPRTITCGHTFCSECITSIISDLLFTCPSCRKTYNAPSANIFPISYVILDLISEMVKDNTDEVSEDSMKSSNPTTRRLKSQITETTSEVESLICKGSSLRLQLQLYAFQLDKWKSDHQQFISQLDEMVREINREKTRIETSLEEEVMVRTEIEQAADALKRQNRTHKIFEDLGKVHLSSENFEKWIKTTEESFPNMKLVTSSQKLRRLYKIGPRNPPISKVEEQEHEECAGGSFNLHQDLTPELTDDRLHGRGASSDEKCPTSSITIQEKIKSAFCSISVQNSDELFDLFAKAEDEVVKKWLLRQLIQRRQVLALQKKKESGKELYARLSLDEKGRVLLYAVSDELVHLEDYSTVIKYAEILRHVPCTSRRTFLEFGVDGRSIGRVFISLIDEGNWTENFLILCLGRERGLTYRHSNILGIWWKGTESEFIHLGDYERNDYSGGRAVVSGVDWKKEIERDIYKKTHTEAGFVQAWIDDSGARVSQFYITTRDRDPRYIDPCFGKVVEGLDVIRDITDRYDDTNIMEVKIIDCGVVLST